MARNRVVVEQVICDVCGKETDDAVAVTLGWGKERWELDLCESDHDSIGGAFDDWIGKGRRISGRAGQRARAGGPGGSGGPGASGGGSDNGAVREWAQANGLKVGTKGRIPQAIRQAYEAATP